MNIYGKDASAHYDVDHGLRFVKRGAQGARQVSCAASDPIASELAEFAGAVRGQGEPEMDGEKGTISLAVVLAGIKSAREGRTVRVAELLDAV